MQEKGQEEKKKAMDMQEKAKKIYVENKKREDLEETITAPKKENRDEQALI